MSGDQPSLFDPVLPFRVVVQRSKRRRRTVGAQLKGDVLEVTVPSWMSKADEARWAEQMATRFARQHTAATVDPEERAKALADRYGLPHPTSVRWVTMATRWGSCTPASGTIRISDRLAAYPPWVLDYVLVHELAHLVHADHSKRFWALVDRYPKAERAKGYLIAKSSGDDDDLDDLVPQPR